MGIPYNVDQDTQIHIVDRYSSRKSFTESFAESNMIFALDWEIISQKPIYIYISIFLIWIIHFRQGFSDDGSTGRSNNGLNGYIQDWSRYLNRRSDGYGAVDDPQTDIGVTINVFV